MHQIITVFKTLAWKGPLNLKPRHPNGQNIKKVHKNIFERNKKQFGNENALFPSLSLSHTHAHCCKNIIFYEKRKIYQRQDVKKLNLQLTLFRFAFHIKLIRLKKLAKKWQLLSLKTNQLIATCNLFVFEELIVLHFCESRLLPFRNV